LKALVRRLSFGLVFSSLHVIYLRKLLSTRKQLALMLRGAEVRARQVGLDSLVTFGQFVVKIG